METVFNEIQHSVKNWWTSLLFGNRVYHCSPLAHVLTRKHLCSSKYHFQCIDADKRYSEIIFALSNRKGVPSWGGISWEDSSTSFWVFT